MARRWLREQREEMEQLPQQEDETPDEPSA
jgi:hypothetical protein